MLSLPVRPNNGYIIYDGPSLLDGERIVVVLSGVKHASENTKTGEMVQTYIIRHDISPAEAIKTGDDESVCGDCIHRRVNGAGSCYVNAGQGVHATWGGVQRGIYPHLSPEDAAKHVVGLLVRLGTYGDPCAVPVGVWNVLLERAEGYTGYTHQWKKRHAQPYRRLIMASVDSERQQRFAQSKGWRTFRTLDKEDAKLSGEVTCPASDEAGKRKTCAECRACDGSRSDTDRRANITLRAHGLHWKVTRWGLARKAMRQKKRFRLAQ